MLEEEEKNENIYGMINTNFDSLMFETYELRNSSINNEKPFKSDITAILKDNKNGKNVNHYLCPTCLFFPYIQIINKNEVFKICQCTGRKGTNFKIKDLINEITNFEDKKNRKIIENDRLECNKHNHKFRYYCPKCHINLCKECCEFHSRKHELIIFDYNNYDIRKKIDKLREYFNSKQNENNQIIKIIPDNSADSNELIGNSSIFQEGLNYDELQNKNKSFVMKIEKDNPNVIIEENNLYYLSELFMNYLKL